MALVDPERVAGKHASCLRSTEVLRIEFHAGFYQEFNEFFQGWLPVMMLLLAFNVLPDDLAFAPAYGERRITFLPGEGAQPDLVLDPDRGCLLDLPHHIGERVRRLQTDQEMDVIVPGAFSESVMTVS